MVVAALVLGTRKTFFFFVIFRAVAGAVQHGKCFWAFAAAAGTTVICLLASGSVRHYGHFV